MSRRGDHHPDQLPLWRYCGMCGGFHYGLEPDIFGRDREHRACGKALDRWYTGHTEVDWDTEPNRACW